LSEPEWGACIEEVQRLTSRDDDIIASGSLALGVPEDFYARLATAAKTSGCRFIVDASGPPLRRALGACVYLAKPNLRELQGILDDPLEDRQSQVRACRRVIEQGGAEIIALTLGSEGALIVTRDAAWFSEPVQVKVMSSVGAGDSFLGALVCSLSSGGDLADALRFAAPWRLDLPPCSRRGRSSPDPRTCGGSRPWSDDILSDAICMADRIMRVIPCRTLV
jgi:6-phosphofructokinase 2